MNLRSKSIKTNSNSEKKETNNFQVLLSENCNLQQMKASSSHQSQIFHFPIQLIELTGAGEFV